MNRKTIRILVIASVFAFAAGQLTTATATEFNGTLKLGGIVKDESGSLTTVQERYNIYDGFNFTQLRLNGTFGPRHYFTLNLRDINLNSRQGNLLYRLPGKFKFDSRYRQNRYIFDPDAAVTSDRYRWGFNLSYTPIKKFSLLANYDFNSRDGDRMGYPPTTAETWLGPGYDYSQHSGGVETQYVWGKRAVAVRYDFTRFANNFDTAENPQAPLTDRRGSVVSARFNTQCAFYDKWTHFLRGAWGQHDVVNADVDFTLLNFQYMAIIKPVQWFRFKYNLFLNRVDDTATDLKTDNMQNIFIGDFYYKYGNVFGGYGFETNDDELALTDYHTYRVGGTYRYEKLLYLKAMYSNRNKIDKEKTTLLQDIESDQFRGALKITWEELVIGSKYSRGERVFPDINAKSIGYRTNGYLSYDLPVWFTIWGDYVYSVEDHTDRVGTYETASNLFTSKLTFDRVRDLYLGFGATYIKVEKDLDIKKTVFSIEGTYTIAGTYIFELKYNAFNYDDLLIRERDYSGDFVWFNVGYNFGVK